MALLEMLLGAVAAASSVHPPEIEARLGILVGDWTRDGKETSYRDHCVWYDRRSFVVCSLTDTSSGLRVEAIVGYSNEQRRFTYESFANDGTSHVQYGYPLGEGGIVFTDERDLDGRAVRLTTSIVRQPNGTLRLAQDRSVMGQKWEQAGEVFYKPRR